MSKTFKSAFIEGRTVRIDGNVNIGIHVAIDHGDDTCLSTSLSASDAPAIALAILEAAGHRPAAYDPERLSGDDLLAYIAHKLAVHVGDEVKRAKEAADREKLEGEALALCNAFQDAGGYARADVMTMHHYDYGKWMDAARKAREIHGAAQ